MKIVVMLPTRARPALFVRAARSAHDTATGKVQIVGVLDHDDQTIDEYRRLVAKQPDMDVVLLQCPSSGCVPKALDWGYRNVEFDIVVLAGDDGLFRSPGWDVRAAAMLAKDPYLIISTDDGRHRKKLECVCCTRRWPEAVGFLVHPAFEHFCADEHIEKIAKLAGRILFDREFVIEHMHPKYGKGEWDEVYLSKRRGGGNARDLSRLEQMIHNGDVEVAATRIREAAAKLENEAEAK